MALYDYIDKVQEFALLTPEERESRDREKMMKRLPIFISILVLAIVFIVWLTDKAKPIRALKDIYSYASKKNTKSRKERTGR